MEIEEAPDGVLLTSPTRTIKVTAGADGLPEIDLAHHDLPLVTLDRRQHALALAMGVSSVYLLA